MLIGLVWLNCGLILLVGGCYIVDFGAALFCVMFGWCLICGGLVGC